MKRLGSPAVRKSELWELKSWIRFLFYLLFMVGLWVTAWPLQASVAFSRKCSCLSLSLYTPVCMWAQGASAWIQAGRVWKVRRRNSFFTLHTYIHTYICIYVYIYMYIYITFLPQLMMAWLTIFFPWQKLLDFSLFPGYWYPVQSSLMGLPRWH